MGLPHSKNKKGNVNKLMDGWISAKLRAMFGKLLVR